MKLIHADIVYSEDRKHLAVHPDSYIAVEKGIVKGIWPEIPEEYSSVPLTDHGDAVLIPAFSDLHVHAPQYLNRGLQMDLLLADWLDKCTFPLEAKYADTEFARLVYDAFVADIVEKGGIVENDRWVVIHESDVVASQCRSMSADRKPKEAVHLLALLGVDIECRQPATDS